MTTPVITGIERAVYMFTNAQLENIARNGADLIQDELGENFHIKKCNSLLLADSYFRLEMEQANNCKLIADFENYIDADNPNVKNHRNFQACKVKKCPVCHWRRSKRVRGCAAWLEYTRETKHFPSS